MGRRLKVAIIGDPNRKGKDNTLIEEAEKAFNAIYVPINQVRLDLDKKMSVTYQGRNLSKMDFVLVLPTITHDEMFYIVSMMLKGKTRPFSYDKYLLTLNDDVLSRSLKHYEVATRRYMFICASKSLPKELNKIKFPVIVKLKSKRIVVQNLRALKDIASFAKRGTPIKIEFPVKTKSIVWVFVIGNEVVASYERSNGSSKFVEVGGDVKKVASKVSSALNCDYCALKLIQDSKGSYLLDKISFSPNFNHFQKITSKNIASYIVSYIKKKEEEKRAEWAGGIIEAVRRFPRQVGISVEEPRRKKKVRKTKRRTVRRRRRSR
jgi:hypothetical protein